MEQKERLKTAACVAFLIAINWRLTKELFSIDYTYHMESIESTHITIARYILSHWPDLSWFQQWYCGIPFQNAYPPLLHMMVALFAKLSGFAVGHSYHAVTAALYCLGPVTLFWMAYYLSKSRWYSFAAGFVYSICSTSVPLMKSVRVDILSPFNLRRLQALVQYGEGPHVASMTLIPVTIVALDFAYRKRRPWCYALAAISIASVALTNWIGAFALGVVILCYLLARDDADGWRTWFTAGMIAIFSYLLAMPWLPPSTAGVIRANSETMGGSYGITIRHLGYAAVLFAVVMLERKLLRGRVSSFSRFVLLFTLFMGAIPLAAEWGKIYLLPQPGRYHLEMEMALALAAVFIWQRLLDRLRDRRWVWVGLLLLVCCYFPWKKARNSAYWLDQPGKIETTIEYKTAAWLGKNMPNARVLLPGSSGFFLNTFNDVPQISGGFEQGITNRAVLGMLYQVFTGQGSGAREGEIAVAWCKAFGLGAVGVSGPKSTEVWKPYWHPNKFEGLLPVAWREGDDVIYRIPQRTSSFAHVIRRQDVVPHKPWDAVHVEPLAGYIAALDDPALPVANLVWKNPHHMVVTADLRKDQLLSIQVTYHLGWRALVNGVARPVREDKIGLIEVEPFCEGRCNVDLIYDGGPEMRLARFLSWGTIIGGLIWILASSLGRTIAFRALSFRWLPNWAWTALAACGVLALNLLLNWPFFRQGASIYPDSIELGYASMARFVAAHPNPWGWNPLEYCGIPTQFTYLPGLLYSTAALVWALPSLEPAQAYRIVTIVFACLAPVTFFLLALYFSKRRSWAFAAACAFTLLSPLHSFISQIDMDQGIMQLPWRLQVLTKYGEGPHLAGLMLLPLAILALWQAGFGKKYWQIFVAAILMAALALVNWVAALALAFCALIFFLTTFRIARVMAAAALAYLLASFWLTPTLVRTVAFNWPTDAFNYHLQQQQRLMLVALIGGIVLLRFALVRLRVEPHLCFLTLGLAAFGWIVLGHYWGSIDTIPESRRYALEFEMFLVLAAFEWARKAVGGGRWAVGSFGIVFVAVLLAGVKPAWIYVTEVYPKWVPVPKEDTLEYDITSRLATQQPVGRVFVSGAVRFRLDAWSDLPQIGGPFESGLRNRIPLHFSYQVRTGIGSAPAREGSDAVMQLKALAVEYVVVHGPKSREYYRDVRNPWKFEGLLKPVYREGDDVIYRMPVSSIAHLVRPAELPAWAPIGGYLGSLPAYDAALDDSSRPALRARWRDPNHLDLSGTIPAGMVVSVAENYDSGWRAWQDGRAVPIETDKLGFMELRAMPSSSARILLEYGGTTEQRVFASISALAWLAAIAGLFVTSRDRKGAGTAP